MEDKKKEEDVKEEKNSNNTKSDTFRVKIGTVGNFMLAAFAILIIGTGALTYYLIHSAKNDNQAS